MQAYELLYATSGAPADVSRVHRHIGTADRIKKTVMAVLHESPL